MSIFNETDYSKIKDKLLNHTINEIKNILNKNNFIDNYSMHNGELIYNKSFSLKWLMNKFIIDVLYEPNYDFYSNNINNIEYLELFFNSCVFLNKYLCKLNFYLNENFVDKLKGIQNSIFIITEANNIDLIEKEIEYEKNTIIFFNFINRDITLLINNINNKNWRDQMFKFFKETKIIEREQILIWFNEHMGNKIRKEIDNNFFNKNRIKDLFFDLNNLYKHLDKENNPHKEQIKNYQNYQKLSEQEKFKKTEEDMHLILYILIEHENKIIS